MHGMPSFSRMMLPNLESATPSVLPSAFFLRNFLRSAYRAACLVLALSVFCESLGTHMRCAKAPDISRFALCKSKQPSQKDLQPATFGEFAVNDGRC